MKQIKLNVDIKASKERLWDITFNQFGDIANYNPNLDSSHFTKGEKGAIGTERRCDLDNKTHVLERIVDAQGTDSFVIDIFDGNMPMVDKVRVKFDLQSIDANRTKVSMNAEYNTKPAFMAALMSGMFKKKFNDLLIGLKYHAETGMKVSKNTYKPLRRQYKSFSDQQAFA